MKRFSAALLVACLAVSLCVIPARAADIIFIAVNDTIPSALNEAAMPFYQDGTLYIPYTTFNNSALDVVPSYDTYGKQLTLSNDNHSLVFDIQGSTVTEDGSIITIRTILIRYGIPFVPLDYTAGYFGISVSYLTSLAGYEVVRLKTGEEVYGDALFIEKAENLIAYRIEQYHPAVDPGPPPNQQTDPQPGEEQEPVVEPPEEEPAGQTYTALAITGINERLLSGMDQLGFYAAFFLTAADAAENRDLLRHAAGSGQRIGVDVRDSEDPLAEIEAFNDGLELILCTRTLMVLCRADQLPALENYFAYPEPEDDGELLLLDAEEALTALVLKRAEGRLPGSLRETTPLPESPSGD